MRRVLADIADRRAAFSELPFFRYLRDASASPAERLSFAPAGAPFIMAFADLNKEVLFVPNSDDPLQKLMNVHSREDATHYDMYLRDLSTLGYDLPLSFTDALEFLWSEDRRNTRRNCYELTAMFAAGSSPVRLAIVEAIEAMGSVAFRTFTGVAAEYKETTGKALEYFGRAHEDLESGHTMGTDDIEQRLLEVVLTEDDYVKARAYVGKVFDLFSAMMGELHEYVLRTR